MKRTYEQSLTFFKHKTDSRGDGRELYKTPHRIIFRIVDNLLSECPELRQKHWIDPCAGDGRWENILRMFDINCESFDIKPLAPDVYTQDFLTSDFKGDCFFIGNPPFSMLKQFVDKALSMAESCYFLGGSQIITGTLSDKVALLHRFTGAEGKQSDERSKVLFEDSNGCQVPVWCCGALFENGKHTGFWRCNHLYGFDRFAVSPKVFCVDDERIIRLKGN